MNDIKRRLPCLLTDDEKLERGIMLGEATLELERLENEAKATAKHYKDRTGGQKAEISDLSDQLRTGREIRIVECTWKMQHPHKNQKTLVRDDSLEEIETQDMSLLDLEKWKNEQRELELQTDPTAFDVVIEDEEGEEEVEEEEEDLGDPQENLDANPDVEEL